MSEENTEITNLISILVNTDSQTDSIREESNKQIMEMQNDPEEFLTQLTKVIQTQDVPLHALQLSFILSSRMLQPHSSDELKKIQESLSNNTDLAEALKLMISKNINNEDEVIRNFASKSYALLFQILIDNWIDGLDMIVSFVSNDEVHPAERFPYLQVFYEITQLTDYEKEIFKEREFIIRFQRLLSQCVNFIGVDFSNEDVNTDIRLMSTKCIINFFHIANSNETYFTNDKGFFKDVIDSLQYSFPLPDINLFQHLLQIIECLIVYGYDIIDDFCETIFTYSMNCFDIPNPEFIEAALYLWSEIAKFEFLTIVKTPESVKDIVEKSSEAILQICKNIFDTAKLSEVLNYNSDIYSLVTTAQTTITNFFKCAPKTVFQIITQKFQIFEKESSPFTTFCFLSSIAVETNLNHFSKQFLLFVHENWSNIILLEQNIISEPDLIQNVDATVTRVYALTTIKKLIDTFKPMPRLLIQQTILEEPTKKLDDIFNLIKSCQERLANEHPAILTCYARLIGKICFLKDKKFTQKQGMYIENNYLCLAQFLYSLFDLNYTQFDPIVIEATTKSLNILISNATVNSEESQIFDFLVFLFKYAEEKINKGADFESSDVRYSFQRSLCSFIGTLGDIMATNNDVCQRSFETLLKLVQNPNSLIYEEALKSVALFIPKVKQLIDPDIIFPLSKNAVDSLDSESKQVIESSSFLLRQMFESIPEQMIEAIPDTFQSLKRVFFNSFNSEFRECQFYILNTLSSIVLNVNPEYTVELKEDLSSIITRSLTDILDTIDTNSQDDLKYAVSFYQFLSEYFFSYIMMLMPEKPQKHEVNDAILDEQRAYLKILRDLSFNIYKIPREYISEELLKCYLALVFAITKKTSRKNDRFLNIQIIKSIFDIAKEKEIDTFIFKISEDEYKEIQIEALETEMRRV